MKAQNACRRAAFLLGGIALLGAGSVTGGVAQEMDQRWLAWMGCWEPVAAEANVEAPESLLCFRPNEAGAGVEMISVEDGEISSREVIRADGQPRESSAEGCDGEQRAVFATRPGRLFFETEQRCGGGVARDSRGMFAMIAPDAWIDARVVAVNGQDVTWVTRYELATQREAEDAGMGGIAADRSMAVRSMRLAASGAYSIDDVVEAANHVDSEVVEAWIVEHDQPLHIDADRLIQLADSGVPQPVIDIMVARSFPEHFAVRGAREYEPPVGHYGYGYHDPYLSGYGRWGYPYSRFGYRYGYGYSPFFGYGYGYGYRGYGYGGYGYPFYGGGYVIRTGGGTDGGGRVIAGRGYSRSGTPRATGSSGSSRGTSSISRTSGSSSGSSTGRTARRRGGSDSSPSVSRSSSSRGRVSSQGYSRSRPSATTSTRTSRGGSSSVRRSSGSSRGSSSVRRSSGSSGSRGTARTATRRGGGS